MSDTVDPRYPVGKFTPPTEFTPEGRTRCIADIEEAPARLRAAVAGLTEAQIATPYRDGGWTIRQVAHHLPDSHMNGYIRFRWALTEDEPTIKAYDEKAWAELPDSREGPIEVSLAILEAVHRRWVLLLKTLTPEEFGRKFRHPESGVVSLDRNLALYAWHGRHHVAHVTALRERMGWK